MKILVYGAGVLGSLYSARLQQAGYDVSLLARGHRLQELQKEGVILETAEGKQSVVRVPAVAALEASDRYDLVIVLVRKNQLPSTLPSLAANWATPPVLFMVNNATGPGALIEALGRERVLLGFPGAGGTREGAVVRYNLVSPLIQPTTLGELDGQTTPRLQQIASALRDAGFPVATSSNIEAWLKSHVALVSPIANALYMMDGDRLRLADSPAAIAEMVRAIREGFEVLEALGIPITPARLRLLRALPLPLLVRVWQPVLRSEWAEVVIACHANVARDEMGLLAAEFRQLAEQAHVAAPAMARLASYI